MIKWWVGWWVGWWMFGGEEFVVYTVIKKVHGGQSLHTCWFMYLYGPFTNLPFAIGKPSILTLRHLNCTFYFFSVVCLATDG